MFNNNHAKKFSTKIRWQRYFENLLKINKKKQFVWNAIFTNDITNSELESHIERGNENPANMANSYLIFSATFPTFCFNPFSNFYDKNKGLVLQ